jgi:hypothetical protein
MESFILGSECWNLVHLTWNDPMDNSFPDKNTNNNILNKIIMGVGQAAQSV